MNPTFRQAALGWLQRKLQAADAIGTRAVSSRWLASAESVDANETRTLVVVGGAHTNELVLIPADSKDSWRVGHRTKGEFTFQSAALSLAEAQRLYQDLRRQMLKAGSSGASSLFRWASLAVVTLAVIVFAPVAGRSPGAYPAGLTADNSAALIAAAQAAVNPPRDAAQPRVTANELTMLRTAAQRSGIALADSGKVFYVFSDPNCPFCQQLEGTLEQLGSGYQPVILPVAYKPGSKDLAQAMLCTKDSKGQRDAAAQRKLWRQALAKPGEALKGAGPADCAEGLTQLTDNMTLFEMLKLTGTPTLITPSGRLFSGASSATVEQLRTALELP